MGVRCGIVADVRQRLKLHPNPCAVFRQRRGIQRAGGDPGFPGLYGPPSMPATQNPTRIAFIQTPGWAAASPGAKAAFYFEFLDKASHLFQTPDTDKSNVGCCDRI